MKHESPFLGELKGVYQAGDIKSLEGTDKLVRLFPEKYFLNLSGKQEIAKDKASKRKLILREAARAKQEFEQLRELGLHTILDIVLAKDREGERTVFLISNHIDGIDANDLLADKELLDELPPEEKHALASELLATLKALIAYFEKCVRVKRPILWDISKLKQYTWGAQAKETTKHLYLVDIEPKYSHETPLSDHVAAFAHNLAAAMDETERALGIDTGELKARLDSFAIRSGDLT